MKSPSEHPQTIEFIKAYMADTDSEWWPFAFLRPKQHQDFTTLRCASLAFLYGIPVGLLAMLAGRLVGDQVQTSHLAIFPLLISAPLFATFRLWIAPFWNRRAAELRPLRERRSQWQSSFTDDD